MPRVTPRHPALAGLVTPPPPPPPPDPAPSPGATRLCTAQGKGPMPSKAAATSKPPSPPSPLPSPRLRRSAPPSPPSPPSSITEEASNGRLRDWVVEVVVAEVPELSPKRPSRVWEISVVVCWGMGLSIPGATGAAPVETPPGTAPAPELPPPLPLWLNKPVRLLQKEAIVRVF